MLVYEERKEVVPDTPSKPLSCQLVTIAVSHSIECNHMRRHADHCGVGKQSRICEQQVSAPASTVLVCEVPQ